MLRGSIGFDYAVLGSAWEFVRAHPNCPVVDQGQLVDIGQRGGPLHCLEPRSIARLESSVPCSSTEFFSVLAGFAGQVKIGKSTSNFFSAAI